MCRQGAQNPGTSLLQKRQQFLLWFFIELREQVEVLGLNHLVCAAESRRQFIKPVAYDFLPSGMPILLARV
jgi:hypothetical protein